MRLCHLVLLLLVSKYATSGIHQMAVYAMKPRTFIDPGLHCLMLLKLRISALVLRRNCARCETLYRLGCWPPI